MKTIFLSSSAWISHQTRCEGLIKRISRTNPTTPESIVLDPATVMREKSENAQDESFQVIEIDFRTWVNETLTEGGVVNVEVIRRAAVQMKAGGIFAINAIGFNSSTIFRALEQLRMGFYTLAEWPVGLVLIGDDSQLNQLSPAFANTFYIQPSIIAKTSVTRMVRQITYEARFLRLFGRRIGFLMGLFAKVFNYLVARRARKEEKKLGWIWEE